MILLGRTNVDYLTVEKQNSIEQFDAKFLDTQNDIENLNVLTKSNVLAPFNSSMVEEESEEIDERMILPFKVVKFTGKTKELNHNYELNNNGDIDNGILIDRVEEKDDKEVVGDHFSPIDSGRRSEETSAKSEKAEKVMEIDEKVLEFFEEKGIRKKGLRKSLELNEKNYVTAGYFLQANFKKH